MKGSLSRGGRIAAVTATTALAVALPLCGTATSPPPGGDPPSGLAGPQNSRPASAEREAAEQESAEQANTAPPSASKPDGPIESSLSVMGTGVVAGAATVMIVRRHQRRSRNGRR
ncbi:hypothetical protein [Streptomyces sp. NBC_00690]|uniref:hypothetical protein n=1 Tax=Streptomyces sp. NBC_00690 TaxID=2975808 RepID=UPI002E2D2069|nr:hypothetical protein [Streptomyces sp. NBC_00690]